MAEIDKFPLTSLDIKEQQIEKLRSLFPEIFTEGARIDWDRLKRTLGEYVDPGKERFGLNWPGKAECFRTIQQPSMATITPCPEESLKSDGTPYAKGEGFCSTEKSSESSHPINPNSGHLFIEGDNLEVLKLLQKSYQNKVKMIYIDPPYNTGNEFIYPDNYSETLDTYLEYTGQVDGEGRKFSTNVDTDGRFHSKWLNMMYPRLFLAKNLLREDGVIFISIDDNEVHNLRGLCNEIFGEENFVASIIWQKKTGSADANNIATITEYILVYSKQILSLKLNQDEGAHDEGRYKFRDDYLEERGPFYYDNLDRGTLGYHQSLDYGVMAPDGKLVFPNGRSNQLNDGWRWKWGKEKLEWGIKNGFIDILPSTTKEIGWGVYYKIYLKVDNEGSASTRSSPYKNLIQGVLNTHASNESKELFSKTGMFSNPKPSQLIKKILEIGSQKEDVILDFFAGSATTAHAVLDLNKEDGGNRKFICVQLPEPTEEKSEAFKAGYSTIAEISKERIRRVSAKIKAEQKAAKEKAQGQLFSENKANENQDLGFHVFKLQPSHFKAWDSQVAKEPEAIQTQIEYQVEHISLQASQEALLFELLLKAGFRLDTRIESLPLAGKQVFSIAEGELLICLEKELTHEVIAAMAERQPSRVICLDLGFQNNDQLKTNAVQIMKSKKVLNFQTV